MKADNARKVAECLALLCAIDSPPVTRRDRMEHAQLVAREYARREARMAPQPQLQLERVA